MSLMVMLPAGMSAVREKGAATEMRGSAASDADRPALTVCIWTSWMKSMMGTSFQQDSAAERSAVQVPTAVLTYFTTSSWSASRSFLISGSSSTVLGLRVCADLPTTFQRPCSSSTSKSKTLRRYPQQYGSERSTSSPDSAFLTVYDGTSTCVWPTRIASMPGTCSATRLEAFSTYGRASP